MSGRYERSSGAVRGASSTSVKPSCRQLIDAYACRRVRCADLLSSRSAVEQEKTSMWLRRFSGDKNES